MPKTLSVYHKEGSMVKNRREYIIKDLGEDGTAMSNQMTNWSFRCDRCLDPTELGSMLNAVVCQRCLPAEEAGKESIGRVGGFMLPVRATDLASPWKCSACDEDAAASEVMATLLRLRRREYIVRIKSFTSSDLASGGCGTHRIQERRVT